MERLSPFSPVKRMSYAQNGKPQPKNKAEERFDEQVRRRLDESQKMKDARADRQLKTHAAEIDNLAEKCDEDPQYIREVARRLLRGEIDLTQPDPTGLISCVREMISKWDPKDP